MTVVAPSVDSPSWARELPPHWEWAKLNRVARLGTGHTPDRTKPHYWEDCTIPWVTAADLSKRANAFEPLMDTEQHISELGLANSAAVLHPSGTVMFCRTASVGLFCQIGRPMATTQAFVTWTPGPRLDGRYLLYTIAAMRPEFDRLAYGSTHLTIYMPDLEALRIPLPPVEEQRRIADFLDDQVARIDELKAVRQQQYELTKEGFTSWLDSQTEEMPLVPLRRLASSITSGPRGWGDLVSDEGDRMFIRINNISAAGIGMNLDDVAWVTPEENAESRRAQLEEGDLLVSITASIGDVSTVDSLVAGSAFSQHVARVRLVDPSRGRDVAWAASTRASRERLRALSFGGTKVGLGLQDVLDWEIPLVPDDAARTFSALTDERFELITNASTALETGLALLEERKRALITAAVTGELDVTTAKPIGMGKWVPNVGAGVEVSAAAQGSGIGGIG